MQRASLAIAALISGVLLFALPADIRSPAAALLVLANVGLWFVLTLWRRDGSLPLFDVGVLCFGFTIVYSVYPVFAFLMSGGTWTQISDNRLQQWNPDSAAVGTFAWQCAVYGVAFAASYVATRGGASAALPLVRRFTSAEAGVALWLLLALSLYFSVLWFVYGVTYEPSYKDVYEGRVGLPADLPYLLQQISHNMKQIRIVLKICLIAALLQCWQQPVCRIALITWLGLETAATFFRMGARTDTAMLYVAAVLLYHRLVRPLSAKAIAATLAVALVVVLGYGFARDLAAARYLAIYGSYWSAQNEFQTLMGTAYDIQRRAATGILQPVPWQLHAADLLRLIPSQLLPFPKVEPSEWYLEHFGGGSRGSGLMFGVIAQAIVGFGWAELIVRGTVLGVLLSLLHRAYLLRADSFWWSVFYACVCVWSYYTFRASTFYFLYFVLYHFVPTILAMKIGNRIIERAVGPLPRVEAVNA
jgi:hypothetical protein